MIEVNRFTLPNGLRVVHHYDSATAMVALNILYDVGARDESPELTGMAHLFEHLMFGGSVNVPDYDTAIEAAGGSNNAWTSDDFTNFYDILPAQNVETAFWLESDRMLGLAFSEKSLEVQRNVVMEEFKQVCLNQPYGDLFHHLRAMVYKTHPYRYPVIGSEPAHIARVTQDDVREFFYSHYAPNNAVLAVTGCISFDETRRLAEKWFGGIPRRDIAPRLYAPEAAQREARRNEVSGNVPQTMIVKAFRMPGFGEKGYVECDIITDLLASGRSSRFYRNLIMGTNMFTDADASIAGFVEPGFLMLNALVNDGVDIAEAEEVLHREAARLADGSLSEYELARTINRFESQRVLSQMGYRKKASPIARAEMLGYDVNAVVSQYRAVTVDDIENAIREVIVPESCSTLIYRSCDA